MCGPSGREKQIEGSEQSFMDTLQANYNTNFANQQAILAHLNASLQPTVAAGPSQTGFSPAETAALNTGAIDTTGANYASAERNVGNELAARDAGGNLPESGTDAALKANIGSAAAGQLSSEELGITEANYATGRQNYENAVAGEEALAGQYNPVGTGQLANTANSTAFSEANTIQQEENQEQADIVGGVVSLAEGVATGGLSEFGGGGGLPSYSFDTLENAGSANEI